MKTKRGMIPIFTVYRHGIPFWQKIRCLSQFKPVKQRYTVYFMPVYGTSNENQLLRAHKNPEGIPIYRLQSRRTSSGKVYAAVFCPDLVLNEARFLQQQRQTHGATHTSINSRTTYHTIYVSIARNVFFDFLVKAYNTKKISPTFLFCFAVALKGLMLSLIHI